MSDGGRKACPPRGRAFSPSSLALLLKLGHQGRLAMRGRTPAGPEIVEALEGSDAFVAAWLEDPQADHL